MTLAGPAQDAVMALDVVVLAALAFAGVSLWLTVRAVRRRVRRFRLRIGAFDLRRDGTTAARRIAAASASASATSLSWWQTQRDRHRVWRAVGVAERAVASAVQAQAPVGELPMLTRRLRRTAQSVDRLLCTADDPSRRSRRVAAEMQLVLELAESIRQAAQDAVLSVAAPATSSLADAVAVEVSALRHGLSVAAMSRR
jgi:hypothetical protein